MTPWKASAGITAALAVETGAGSPAAAERRSQLRTTAGPTPTVRKMYGWAGQ